MQDLIRTIIELAPGWTIGIAALAAIRLSVGLALTEFMGRWLHRLDVWQEQIEQRGEEFTREDVSGALSIGAGAVFGALALGGVFTWYFVAIWQVIVADAPAHVAAGCWWLGLLLAAAHLLPGALRSRRLNIPRRPKIVLFYFTVMAAVFWVAPLGILLYSAIVFVGNIPIGIHQDGLRERLKR